MISLEQAREEILARVTPLAPVKVELEALQGRFLAEDITAREDIPPFDNSAMDGFALRHDDVARASEAQPVHLPVRRVAEAGSDLRDPVPPGEAARIYTGAPIPPGTDCIVPFENAFRFDDDSVVIARPPGPAAHVRRRGSDLTAGSVVLRAGTRLTPAAVGILATVGRVRVSVGRRPRVAVHSSGNELVPVEEELAPGKIRNSNLFSLAARVEQWGAIALRRPVLLDTMEAVRAGLRQTLTLRPDAIVTTGGISAGDLDFVREVARELGDGVEVRRVAMKPGKPLVYGLLGGVPFFGLPGNPAACLVSFEIFVRPALAHLEGRPDGIPARARARVHEDQELGSTPRLQLLRGRVAYDLESAEYLLDPPGPQSSHLLSSFSAANCLVEVPPGQSRLAAGELVTVLLLD